MIHEMVRRDAQEMSTKLEETEDLYGLIKIQ